MGIQTGTITATGQTTPVTLGTRFSLSMDGFGTATIALERSFDGSTWAAVESYTADTEKTGDSAENAQYRLNCTAYTSGTITYRLAG